jgi:ABC-type transport system involved in multi-copper enzyme maturation permease subunit
VRENELDRAATHGEVVGLVDHRSTGVRDRNSAFPANDLRGALSLDWMSLLSISERELRVAARKRRTYEIRMSTAIIGLAVCASTLELVTVTGASAIPGDLLFRVLSWITFGSVCITGSLLSADSVSREKREGTLGLLFLANLRGASVALGKLFSHGLIALYSVLGMMPVMAIPLLLGGGDLASLGRAGLAFILTLLIALTIALICSTLCERAWTASAAAISSMAVLTIGIPLAVTWLVALGYKESGSWIGRLSPSYLLSMSSWTAQNLSVNHFWTALGLQTAGLAVAIVCLFRLLSGAWQDRPISAGTHPSRRAWNRFRYGSGKRRLLLRKNLLGRNPLLWLSARQPYPSSAFVLFIGLVGILITCIGARQSAAPGPQAPDAFIVPLLIWLWTLPALYLILCFRIAVVASERFAADRKSGALELILSTPITVAEIVRGQWLAIIRQVWGPALFLLLLHGFILEWVVEGFTLDFHAPGSLRGLITAPLLHFAGKLDLTAAAPFYILPLAIMAAAGLIIVLWVALGWIGMFLGLKVERQIAAPWSALVLLAIPPFPLFFGFALLIFQRDYFADDVFERLLAVGFGGFVCVLGNALFWRWFCRRWVYANLRRAVAEGPRRKGLFRMV